MLSNSRQAANWCSVPAHLLLPLHGWAMAACQGPSCHLPGEDLQQMICRQRFKSALLRQLLATTAKW
jgi:hypothetical protein